MKQTLFFDGFVYFRGYSITGYYGKANCLFNVVYGSTLNNDDSDDVNVYSGITSHSGIRDSGVHYIWSNYSQSLVGSKYVL